MSNYENTKYENKNFDAIAIPEELSKTVSSAIRRGIAYRIGKSVVSGILMVVLFLGVSANVTAIYSYAAQIPVLGKIVKIMHVGSGGTGGQTVCGQLSGDGRKVYLQFTNSLGDVSVIPQYSVRQLKYPYGTVIHLHNVEQIDVQNFIKELERIPGVYQAYPLVLSDQKDVGITILLAKRSTCVVSELENNILEISFFPKDSSQTQSGYLLCSKPMEPGSELIQMYEALAWEGCFQLLEPAGTYRIALGPYANQEQARKAQKGIEAVRGISLQITPIAPQKEG